MRKARRRQPKDELKRGRHDPSWPPVDTAKPKLSFEEALTKLEAIVESMESGDVPLADLLARFEEGKLLKCAKSV